MSVHGEYGRALAGVMERLGDGPPRLRETFRSALDAARVTAERDLSTAARTALAVLDELEQALDAPEPELRLREACDHLRAHVEAILGVPRTRR